MIETSSGLPRESSANVRERSSGLRNNFAKSSESDRKSSENSEQRRHQYVYIIKRTFHALGRRYEFYYIHTEIYAPKSVEIKIVFSRSRSQLIGHTFFFTGETRRIDAMICDITIFTSEKNHVARSPILFADK